MKFLEKLKSVTGMVLATLGLSELPIKNGKLDLSEWQKTKLEENLGKDRVAQMISALDTEIAAYHSQKATVQEEMQAIDAELNKLLADHNPRSDMDNESVNAQENETAELELKDKVKALGEKYDTLLAKYDDSQEKIKALSELPEFDNTLLKNMNVKESLLKHSSTHLFSSGKAYDLLERKWNARALNQKLGATDFTDPVTISTLNNDLKLYYRDNPDVILSLERDNFDLPPFWDKKTNVSDETSEASVVTAEITQARKLPWLPKNKHHIEGEIGKVFPIQIDIQYVGFYLQRIETSWVNFMNKEGSQPYKMSFVAFLVNEIRKVQRVEDRIATINGVYVNPPEDMTTPGRLLNRQNGLRYILWRARDVEKKYRPFNLGHPTPINIVDYEDAFINSLPDEIKNRTDLVFYKSPSWLKAYKDRYEDLYGNNNDYEGVPNHPRNFSNIEYCTLVDLEGSDFMFITTKDNIILLEMLPAERGLYHLERLLRNIYIWADYKIGVMLKHIGNSKIKPTDPEKFRIQTVWSNNVPIFEKRYKAYQYDDKTGVINAHHNFLAVNSDWKTDITEIKPLYKGQVIRITGDTSLENSKFIKKNADLALTSNFDLKSGGTLTLISEDKEGKWKELFRTEEAETIPSALEFTTVIDATSAIEFRYNGTSDTTLAAITNGVDTQIITIYGGENGKITIPKGLGNINLNADEVLNDATEKLKLVLVNGIWYKQTA